MRPAEFEPTILVSERPQTHALDRTATGIDMELTQYVLYYNLFYDILVSRDSFENAAFQHETGQWSKTKTSVKR
jgi:hypothetical protein